MKKRVLSLLLIISMLFTMLPSTGLASEPGNPFGDVTESDWFYDDVLYAYENQLFSGNGEGDFDPNGTMTRSMYVTVMGRMINADIQQYADDEPIFTDVSADAWYAPYVAWAVDKGITAGVGDDRFDPDGLVTREQMAALAYRFMNVYQVPMPIQVRSSLPTDMDQVSDWAVEAVTALWSCSMFVGDGSGAFVPLADSSRAEGASFFNRMHRHCIDSGIIPDPNGPATYTVSFYDGDKLIHNVSVEEGQSVDQVPTLEQTSKADYIFVGWYADPELTEPFYADEPVTADTKVYGKYESMGTQETIVIDSFSKMDQDKDVSFVIRGTGDPAQAVSLIVKDGTEAPELVFTANGGTYTVSAKDGFREGSSYELVLAEGSGFVFVGEEGDMPETIHTAAFSIAKRTVDTLEMNEDIIYIQDTESMNYSGVDSDEDGLFDDTTEVLWPNMTYDANGAVVTNVTAQVQVGDIVCFYMNVHPQDRDYINVAYTEDPEVYVKVAAVDGTTVTIQAMTQEDMGGVYDIPNVFPMVGENTGTISIEALDLEAYAVIDSENPTVDSAKAVINAGDFVAIYSDRDQISEETITYGKVTGYDEETGMITYVVCTADDITGSRDLYAQPALSGGDLVSPEEAAQIEATMYQQVLASGFAEEAAQALANMAVQTDSFKNMENLASLNLTDATGRKLDARALGNLGASFDLSEGVELSVELITEGDELHFDDGLQVAVHISADFEVKGEDGKVAISLNATFIEELEVKPTVDGNLTYYKLLGMIPVPNGVRVTAAIDVKDYTAYDFDITAYTVADEDEPLWDKLKDIAKNPTKITEILSDSGLIPDKFAGQLETIGDIFAKIEEVEKKISDAKAKYEETTETIEEYHEDLEALWEVVGDLHGKGIDDQLFTVETWKETAQSLSKTNIAQELLSLTEDGITDGDAGVDNDVTIKSVAELMERYSEMLQKETDWVTLLDQNLAHQVIPVKCINITIDINLMIRSNMSIALGSTLEYEMGKRYTFWFKVGLYKPTGGSSTMDLIDEKLAFQFYVMGKLELKIGAKLALGVNIGCDELCNAKIYTELGPYVKLYGFFIYTYQSHREANTLTPVKDIRKMGALFMELGLYLIVGVEASAIDDLFSASYDFVDAEFPFLFAGEELYPYEFTTVFEEDEQVVIRDEDGNSANGVTMVLPESLRSVTYMTLTNGIVGAKSYDYDNYYYSFSNPNFSMVDGVVQVDVPDGVRYMECDLTLTYRYGKMAFSDYDMSLTIPLVWTNLTDQELKEFYTVSVRAGNPTDGYVTVWTDRVRKDEAFQLPSDAQVKELLHFSEWKYTAAQGYGSQSTDIAEGVIQDTVYDYHTEKRTYSLTVDGIQAADGTTYSDVFTAAFGEAFDFGELEATGTAKEGEEYTAFSNVTTEAYIIIGTDENGMPATQTIDLSQPISERIAMALTEGITATANYVDDTVTATFTFRGLDHEDVVQKRKKGETADISAIETIVAMQGLMIKDLSPALGVMNADTVYVVVCGELVGDEFTVTFEENGGSLVDDITKVGGALMGQLPVPEKTGYSFGGWYLDNGTFAEAFAPTFMPKENVTVYAKWVANEYQVTLNVNGGNETLDPLTVTYEQLYGELPKPSRSGHGFVGWFTEAEGGVQVLATDIYTLTEDQTLYAQWRVLKVISEDIFTFEKPANPVYDKNSSYDNRGNVHFNEMTGESYEWYEFTVEYKLDGSTDDYVAEPKNAGTYIAHVTRPADDYYEKFDATYTDVLTIDKATRVVPEGGYELAYTDLGYTYVVLQAKTELIDDLSAVSRIVYKMDSRSNETGIFDNLVPGTQHTVTIDIVGDSNYNDVIGAAAYETGSGTTLTYVASQPIPTEEWANKTEEIDLTAETIVVSTAGQLAYIAQQVNGGNSLAGKKIELANDIDLSGAKWTPIGISAARFAAHFDGKGYTIRGMVVSQASGTDFNGLFGYVEDATIENVVVDDSYVSGDYSNGGIVGCSDNTLYILNCTSYAVINGTENSGGMIGYAEYNGQIIGCVNYGNITNTGGNVGGIAGYASISLIFDCVNYGNLTSGGEDTGGIVGYTGAHISSCTNYGSVYGAGNHTGGIYGYNWSSDILNSANRGNVNGHDCVGGVGGENIDTKDCEVYNCYTSGQTQGYGKYIGAIIGRNQSNKGYLHQCYYLHQSCKDFDNYRNAIGTEDSSLGDGEGKSGHYNCASFNPAGSTAAQTTLSRQCEDGASPNTLLNALQHWVERVNNDNGTTHLGWYEAEDGYPALNHRTFLASSLEIR